MLKFYSIFAIFLSLILIIAGCSTTNGPISQGTPTPAPAPTLAPTPTPTFTPVPPPVFVRVPTPAPTPSCAFLIFFCSTPTPSPCHPSYVYDNLVNEGQSWEVVEQQQDQNKSPSSLRVTFTSKTSKTVTVSDKEDLTITVDGSANASVGPIDATITARVKLQINHDVFQSVTTTIDNSVTYTIPAGETAYANYGVKIQITSGHLYDQAGCEGKKSDRGTDVTYVPIAPGWCVWTSDEPSCSSI